MAQRFSGANALKRALSARLVFCILSLKSENRIMAMAGKTKAGFTKRVENGRLRLIPTNEAADTVEKLAPAFKKAAEYMINNRFPGILSNAK
jgi:hypothetical protein